MCEVAENTRPDDTAMKVELKLTDSAMFAQFVARCKASRGYVDCCVMLVVCMCVCYRNGYALKEMYGGV